MDKQQEIFFDELTEDRKKNADVFEKPSAWGAISDASNKYSEQAHFIYELLQNADDAGATSARFVLFEDKLVFAHDGKRRFTVSNPNPETEGEDAKNGCLGDINSITSIGNSTKAREPNKIGKFGMGFWAVRQYTATPYIFDPDIFFKIERACVPIRIFDDFVGRGRDETLFMLPFDHKTCSPKRAYSEISKKLRSLDHPLLFLPSLKNISFEIDGIIGSYGKIVEERHVFGDVTAEYIRLIQNDDGNSDEITLWLFSRRDENGHIYSVGFFVSKDRRLMPKEHTAFCFFPTKKQTKLKFIINAPFLLNSSREGILAGEQYNVDRIDLLAKLAADSLVFLKKIGLSKKQKLIDDGIFNIVPYDEGDFTDIVDTDSISFKPFYTEIKKVFESETIIPASGGYAATKDAYWAFVPEIAKLFSNKQLAALTDNKSAKWVFTSFGRQVKLRREIKLTEYIDDIIAECLNESDILNKITPQFIETQPIEWLHRFYKWIAETQGRMEMILSKPIFLDQRRKAAAAFDDKGAILFLPTEGGGDYTTVNEDLIQNEDTLKLLKQIGIGEPSLLDEIRNKILPQYESDNEIDTIPHFKKFFRYYQTCPRDKEEEFLNLIKYVSFVIYTSASDEKEYRGKADELYFPFEPLLKWFKMKPETKFISFDKYLVVGDKKKEKLIEFLKALGIKDTPRICSRGLTKEEAYEIKNDWQEPVWKKKEPTWIERYIDGCQEAMPHIIDTQDEYLSLFLWNQLIKFAKCRLLHHLMYGYYEYGLYCGECYESYETIRLRTSPWLINLDGEFVSANELTSQSINRKYDISSGEAAELLTILGIADKGSIAAYAESLGLTEEEQRQALFKEYAYKRDKKAAIQSSEKSNEPADDDDVPVIAPSIKRVVRDIEKRTVSAGNERLQPLQGDNDDIPTDEDDYSKPAVDISKKIEKVKEQAERDIKEIARLEDLRQQANDAVKYSFAWFMALLELESLNGENNAASLEISISFKKVEHEEGTSRTLVLSHPNRYIPQSMEDLADIPLEFHFNSLPMKKVAIEVSSVKSYTLRVKLKTNAEIDGVDLSHVVEAKIIAKNPVFLIGELKKAFEKLELDGDYDMQKNLAENIEFVFGPPGTGKTTYLAEKVICPLMRKNDDLKVLVLTPTNKAADVLTRRIMDMSGASAYDDWLIRFGTTDDIFVEQSGVYRDKTFDIRSFKRNVTVTTIARFPYDFFLPEDGSRLHLHALKWDYIIFDEASMIPIANIIYPLYKKTPKKFIIAGDPFQIEPITTIDLWKDENIYTMVKLDSFKKPTTIPHKYRVQLLKTQYRSIPAIGEVFSNFAYGGILSHHRSSESQRAIKIDGYPLVKPLNIIKFPVSKYESIYRPKRLQKKSNYQIYSALFAYEFVKHMVKHIDLQGRDGVFRIGVVAPYGAQSDLINKLVASIGLFRNRIDIQIGTIHGFQGDECDIIIAIFNPPPTISISKDMFLNKLNIINVSISRARDCLFVIMPDDDTENVDNLFLIKKVEQLCKLQPEWAETRSHDIEKQILGSSTFIEDNSFSTSHQLVNVYGEPEKIYEIRSEDNAVDVQVHKNLLKGVYNRSEADKLKENL